jgi:hypothetical protein
MLTMRTFVGGMYGRSEDRRYRAGLRLKRRTYLTTRLSMSDLNSISQTFTAFITIIWSTWKPQAGAAAVLRLRK